MLASQWKKLRGEQVAVENVIGQQQAGAPFAGDEERAAQIRAERQHNIRIAAEMLNEFQSFQDLVMMMEFLNLELSLMAKLLHTTSAAWDLEQCEAMQRHGFSRVPCQEAQSRRRHQCHA